MSRLDPKARAMLRAYRRAKDPAPGEHEALWSRIESSLDQGALGPLVEPPTAPSPPPTAAAWLGPAVISVALAAAVIAALSLLPRAAANRGAREVPTTAPHGAVPVEPARVEPAETTRGEPAAAVVGADDGPRPAAEGVPSIAPLPRIRPTEPSEGRAPGRSPGEPAPEPAVDELQLELAMIRRAREALREQHPERALELLDAHAKAFPSGQMLEDRQALRIEALCAAGKAPQGRAEITAFLRTFPGSAHTARVRESCR